jgi:2,3-diaminopropionate biosynthesis protein SbnA
MMQDGLVAAIGRTPLIRLRHFPNNKQLQVYAKLEFMNPCGSAKDRPALRMLQSAWQAGSINQQSIIVESSSGNMAISLAALCRTVGLPFVCVLDPKTSAQNVRLLEALGATIEWVTEPDPESGQFLPARLARVQQLLQADKRAVWLNQYENPANYEAHRETTMPEIAAELADVDYIFCGVSTCGTLRGYAEYIHKAGSQTKLIAVDIEGSAIFGQASSGVRRFPGLGAGIIPPFLRAMDADSVVHVTDADCVHGCRRLTATEGLLTGASSGGVCAAFAQLEETMPTDAVCVLILHDRGERYLDTVYNDEWIASQWSAHELQVKEEW